MDYAEKLRTSNEALIENIKELLHLHEVYMRTLENSPSVQRMKIRHADNCIHHECRMQGIYGSSRHFTSEQTLEFANQELNRRLIELKTVNELTNHLKKNDDIDALKENYKALEEYCKKHNIKNKIYGDPK